MKTYQSELKKEKFFQYNASYEVAMASIDEAKSRVEKLIVTL
jgi:hypothetical protein